MSIETGPADSRSRTIVYVDSFNWYFSVFKHRPAWKWLDIQRFFQELRNQEDLVKVKVFSAVVHPHWHRSDQRDRQKRYFKALSSSNRLQLILGTYQDREVTCRARCREMYRVPEEKKTDVNIAINMLDDAIKGTTDNCILVSGDSDLQPAVKWMRDNYPKIAITVYVPSLPDDEQYRGAAGVSYYNQIGVTWKFLPLGKMAEYQFPKVVALRDGSKVERPSSWV